MELIVIGANHKSAPLKIREELSLTTKEERNLLTSIKSATSLQEGIVVSTCNRTEIYVVADDKSYATEFIFQHLKQISNLNIQQIKEHVYLQYGFEAVNHLFQVASGLNSLVIGETQILGQLKAAFELAQELETVDKYLYKLFTEAFRTGKRARSETEIGANAASVSYVAVELANDIFGSLSGETVLILGAGEMSELTLKNLVSYGVKGVMVANRTYKRGKELASKFDGEAVTWDQLEEWVDDVDIIIASTGAPHYVLHYNMVQRAMEKKRGPLFLIDIAVPRDIEPEISELPGVHLYDIDDLEAVVEKNLAQRQEEVTAVEEIIDQKLIQFESWLNHQQVLPLLKNMRQKAGKIKSQELNRALKQLDNSDRSSEEIVTSLANRLVNKLLHSPTIRLKEIANTKNSQQRIKIIEDLFSND
ncbi:glutamyl-tRNA reductase [Halanaerocella petrolearia]